MAIKKYRPYTPSSRFRTTSDFAELTSSTPEKSLMEPNPKKAGRNNKGRITARRRGGGHKRQYRIVDFRREKFDIPARVASIEYDPNRSSHIALLHYADGEKRYMLYPKGLKVNDTVVSGENAEYKLGNALPLARMPLGAEVHNIEMRPGKGGQMVRGAGGLAQLVAREGGMVTLRLPSGEVRLTSEKCLATVGQLGNIEHKNIVLGKAGASRWRGRRPKVRGVAMNPVDHPMGGGEGRSSGGRHPCTPWGKPTKGYKTRKKRKLSDKMIVERRKKKR